MVDKNGCCRPYLAVMAGSIGEYHGLGAALRYVLRPSHPLKLAHGYAQSIRVISDNFAGATPDKSFERLLAPSKVQDIFTPSNNVISRIFL